MECFNTISCYDYTKPVFVETCIPCTIINEEVYPIDTIFRININRSDDYCPNDFNICDYISSITVNCTIFVSPSFPYPEGGIFIRDFVYWDSDTNSYTLEETPIFMGFTLEDQFGIAIDFESECNDITICFLQQQKINDTVLDFKLKVLYLQKNYADKVLKIIKKLQFGHSCLKELSDLKILKEVLIILNNYNVQDIILGTVTYNNLSYEIIKKIIYKLK